MYPPQFAHLSSSRRQLHNQPLPSCKMIPHPQLLPPYRPDRPPYCPAPPEHRGGSSGGPSSGASDLPGCGGARRLLQAQVRPITTSRGLLQASHHVPQSRPTLVSWMAPSLDTVRRSLLSLQAKARTRPMAATRSPLALHTAAPHLSQPVARRPPPQSRQRTMSMTWRAFNRGFLQSTPKPLAPSTGSTNRLHSPFISSTKLSTNRWLVSLIEVYYKICPLFGP